MGPTREGDHDDGNGISYPSPSAEAMDAGPFYHTGARDGVQDHEHEDHGELHQPDHGSPQHHSSRPSNLEELQLAAQLGHGLAGDSMMPATDPSMNVDDPNLRNLMPHPEPDVHHSQAYPQEGATGGMPHDHMPIPVAPPMPQQYSMNDGIPPRKRSKVSRACDECRRKKIKCDAQADTGDSPCSSCARSNIQCLFSRVPQKRGPSKGYIKELADRINSIEHKLETDGGLNHEDLERLFAPERHRAQSSAGPADESSRKRPFSSISTGDFNTPTGARQAPWGSEPRPIQPASAESDSYAHYNSSALAPQASAIKVDGVLSRTPVAVMDVPMPGSEDIPDIDDGILHDYEMAVEPVYPILPRDKSRMTQLLAQSPSPVRTAFLNAVLAITDPSSGNVKLASSLLNDWESSEAPRTQSANIVHAQALLLLIVEAGWRTSSTVPFLLARAVALANTMKLWRYTSVDAAADPDSEEQLCVRIWWSLVLMDRWHAAGTGKPVQIPDSSAVAPPGLAAVLGDVSFYVLRLSKFLSRASNAISALEPGSSTTSTPVAAILTDYIENYREDLPETVTPGTHPLVHLAYWHCRLMAILLTPHASTAELLWPARELTAMLTTHSDLRSPLTHHFASLAALALGSLARLDGARDEAEQLAHEALDRPAGGAWDLVRERLAALGRPTSSSMEAASQGLQHLADLATAHEGSVLEAGGGLSLAEGYLGME